MFSEFFESLWWLLVLIGVMIIVHELGHYWAARFFDVKVEAFSFGFGPRLFGFRKGETDFRFSLILLGGYVKMAGEQLGEAGVLDPRSLLAKPRWQRMVVAFAGPAMNIVLSIAILTGLFMVHFERLPIRHSPTVGYVTPDGQAARVGVKEGDRVVKVDSVENPTWHDLQVRELTDTNRSMELAVDRSGSPLHFSIALPADDRTHIGTAGLHEEREILIADFTKDLSPARDAGLKVGDQLKLIGGVPIRSGVNVNRVVTESAGKPIEIVYARNGVEHTVTVKPHWRRPDAEAAPEAGAPAAAAPVERWVIGIYMQVATETVKMSFPEAFRESLSKNWENAGLIYGSIQGMIERRFSPKSMDGPIGIARLARREAKQGPFAFFDLMTQVSMNLAIFNLLPIPILDGGVILMLLIEMIRRQDLSMQFKETVFKIGFAFLMMVVVFVIYNDISKQRAESSPPSPPPAVVQPQHQPAKP